MESEQLSSAATGFYRYIFAPVWILSFGYGTLRLVLRPESVVFNGVRGSATAVDQALFVAMWVLGTAYILWFVMPLRSVALRGHRLLVRHRGEEVSVPVTAVRAVRQVPLLRPHCAVLELDRDYEVGRTIRYLLPRRLGVARMWNPFAEHPALAELRTRLRARGALKMETAA